MNTLQWIGLLFAAALGTTVALFRKYYMPSTDHISEIPDPPIVPASPPEALIRSVEASSTPKPTIVAFCNAIALYEGGPGDANHRNNNPGNCRYNPSGYMPFYGVVGKSPNGFAIFKDWNTGMLYLVNMIKGMIHKRPNETILQFMTRYAPTSDGNNPLKYSQFIAKQLSTDTSFIMGHLV